MSTVKQINTYVNELPEPKRSELSSLHNIISKHASPKSKLWFLDGRNEEGKIVANPNIGYGDYTKEYADGTTKEFYRVGLSANTTGISVYIMGLEDKTFLIKKYGAKIGKAKVTGYCIKFKSIAEIDMRVLEEIIAGALSM